MTQPGDCPFTRDLQLQSLNFRMVVCHFLQLWWMLNWDGTIFVPTLTSPSSTIFQPSTVIVQGPYNSASEYHMRSHWKPKEQM